MSNTKNSSAKRPKGRNFKQEETRLLLSCVEKYKNVIENKQTDGTSAELKNKTWQKLSQEFNCSPAENGETRELRTCIQLKNYYENYKRKIRKDNADDKAQLYKTGGGEFVKKLDLDGERLIGMLRPQFEPDTNKFDSASKYHDKTVNQESVNLIDDTSDIYDDEDDDSELLRSRISLAARVSNFKESIRHVEGQDSVAENQRLVRTTPVKVSSQADNKPWPVASSSQTSLEELEVQTNPSYSDKRQIQTVQGNGGRKRISQTYESSKLELLEIEKKIKRDIVNQNLELHERAMEKLACEIERSKQARKHDQELHELEITKIKIEIQFKQTQINLRLAAIE